MGVQTSDVVRMPYLYSFGVGFRWMLGVAMTGSKIHRANRYAAIVILSNLNTLLVHVHGGLYRMVQAECRDAFTDKEKEFILKRKNIIEQCQRDLSALGHRMRERYNQNV